MPFPIAGAIIGGAALSAAGGLFGGYSQRRAAERSQQAYASGLEALLAGAGSNVFGEKPEAVLYEPIDLTQSQLDTISGNLRAFPSANKLSQRTNRAVIANDLDRIRALYPGYDQALNSFSDSTQKMLQGELPFAEDVYDIVGNRAELAASLGTAGAQAPATAKDLGLARQDLFNRGSSLFQQWLQTADAAVSPISAQMRPQQMYFAPQERAQLDIQQAMLKQQSGQSAAFIEAMPDPVASGRFQAQLGALPYLTGAGGGGGGGFAGGLGAALPAIGSAVSALGTYYGSRSASAPQAYAPPASSSYGAYDYSMATSNGLEGVRQAQPLTSTNYGTSYQPSGNAFSYQPAGYGYGTK